MEPLSRHLLHAIEAYESEHARWPTVPELAESLGIPPTFGHHHLVQRIQRQVVLGRLSPCGARVQLTDAGRTVLAREAAPRRSSRSRLAKAASTTR